MLFVMIPTIHLIVHVQVVSLVMPLLNVKIAQLRTTVINFVTFVVDRSSHIQPNLITI